MNTRDATPPESLSDDASGAGADWARSLIERQLAMMGELAQVGLEIVETIGRRAKAEGVDVGELALAYARASRAVRLTILLQSKMIDRLQGHERRRESEAITANWEARQARKAADAAHRAADHAHKGRIQVIVNRVADADHPENPELVDRLVDEACEKLRDDDQFGDVLDRPISEVVALICRDLGLAPDWPRLAEEAWAREEIAGGAVGAPLAGLAQDRLPEDRPASAAPPDRRVVHAAPS